MAYHLLNGLKALPGVDLFVVLLNKGRLAKELENSEVPVYVLEERKRSFLEIARMGARIVRKWAPQILHSHRYKENMLSYLISMAMIENAALVSTQHGMPEFYGGCPRRVDRLKSKLNYRLLASRFDRVVAVSFDIQDSLVRAHGFQTNRVAMVHNGTVVPKTFRSCRAKDVLVIGSAGRFFPVKDYCFMVEVAREVTIKTDKVRFELAGEGPSLGDIQGLVNRYALGAHFVFRGSLHDVSAFYQGLDVYLNTSLHEGIPMSVIEAMAYGLPAIVPSVGGLKEIVTNGVDGYLLNVRDPKEFANRCLSLYEDETLRRKMAHAARQKIAARFSVERMVSQYAELYKAIVGRNTQ